MILQIINKLWCQFFSSSNLEKEECSCYALVQYKIIITRHNGSRYSLHMFRVEFKNTKLYRHPISSYTYIWVGKLPHAFWWIILDKNLQSCQAGRASQQAVYLFRCLWPKKNKLPTAAATKKELHLGAFLIFFLKWANPGIFFVYFRPFLITISIIQIENSVDCVIGIRTWTKPWSYAGCPLVFYFYFCHHRRCRCCFLSRSLARW